MAAKRTVELVTAAPVPEPSAADVAAEAMEPPREKATPQRGPTGQFLPASKPTEREWKPDVNPFESMRGQFKPPADGDAPPAEEAPETPPAEEAPEETPPAAAQGVEVPTAYLTAEQRKELATRLEQSKAERHKDTELQRMQKELETAKQRGPVQLKDFLAAKGFASQEELLEAMLLGRNLDGGDAPATAPPVNPEIAALRAKIDQLEKERNEERQAAMAATTQAQRAAAVQTLQTRFTKETHPMLASLKQYDALMQRCEQLYDGTTDVHQIAQLAAAEMEDSLRSAYPDIAAVVAAGAPAAKPLASVPAAAAAMVKPKPSVGSRGGAVATPPADDGPLDPAERSVWAKQKMGWKTF